MCDAVKLSITVTLTVSGLSSSSVFGSMKVDCVSVRFVPSFIVTFGPASTTGA